MKISGLPAQDALTLGLLFETEDESGRSEKVTAAEMQSLMVRTGNYVPTFGNWHPGYDPQVSWSYRGGMLDIYGRITLAEGWVGYGNTGAAWSFHPPAGFVEHAPYGVVPMIGDLTVSVPGTALFRGFLSWGNVGGAKISFQWLQPEGDRVKPMDLYAGAPVPFLTGSDFIFHCSIPGWFP